MIHDSQVMCNKINLLIITIADI